MAVQNERAVMSRRGRWLLSGGAVLIAVMFGLGVWISSGRNPSDLPNDGRGAFAATAAGTSAVAESQVKRPPERWSPFVMTVREGHSDVLLMEVMTQLQANREKLHTLHVSGVETGRGWDAAAHEWYDAGELVRGEAWISLEPGNERERLETMKAAINHETHAKTITRSVALWDGHRTLTLEKGMNGVGLARLSIAAVRDLEAEAGATGSHANIRLAEFHGMEGDGTTWHNGYELDPAMFAGYALKASRVMLEDGRDAVELELRPNLANLHYIRYWFDERHGYAMVGKQEGSDDRAYKISEMMVEELVEAAPGIYYPARIRGGYFFGEDDQQTYEWKLLKVEANQTIAEEQFVLVLPEVEEVIYTAQHYPGQAAATRGSTAVSRRGAGFVLPEK
jgi:hypothetical protein